MSVCVFEFESFIAHNSWSGTFNSVASGGCIDGCVIVHRSMYVCMYVPFKCPTYTLYIDREQMTAHLIFIFALLYFPLSSLLFFSSSAPLFSISFMPPVLLFLFLTSFFYYLFFYKNKTRIKFDSFLTNRKCDCVYTSKCILYILDIV